MKEIGLGVHTILVFVRFCRSRASLVDCQKSSLQVAHKSSKKSDEDGFVFGLLFFSYEFRFVTMDEVNDVAHSQRIPHNSRVLIF